MGHIVFIKHKSFPLPNRNELHQTAWTVQVHCLEDLVGGVYQWSGLMVLFTGEMMVLMAHVEPVVRKIDFQA